MDVPDEDLRIDVIRVADGQPCAVRVIHIPTGITETVEDQPTIRENREVALNRLLDRLRS